MGWVSGFIERVKGHGGKRRLGKASNRPRRRLRAHNRRLLCEPLESRRLLSTDGATLVSQTVANSAVELPGAFFSQTWTIKNTGTSTWSPGTSGYTLNLLGTDVLGITSATPDTASGHYHVITVINGGGSVAPNGTATFTMSCIAPETPGTYTDTFQMNSASSVFFGQQVTVQIVVSQAGPAGSYDRARAVSYANNNAGFVVTDGYFWDGPNVSDITYYGAGQPVPTNLVGDDCAHFVSSCIGTPASGLGGGLTIATRVAPSYGEPGAQHLVQTTLIGGGHATAVSSYSSLQPGDVIGWDWTSDGSIDHVTIYLGNGQIASHANSHLDVPDTFYNSSSPNLTSYPTHINSPATRYIALSGNLAFGNVTAGSSAQTTLTIYNGGNTSLNVTSISLPSGFSGNWSGTIPSAGTQTVTVTFSPTAGTGYGGTVTVNSNDTAGTGTMSASGTGVKIVTTAALAAGGTPTYGHALTFTATVTPASGSGETGTMQFQIDGTNAGSPVALGGNTAAYTTFRSERGKSFHRGNLFGRRQVHRQHEQYGRRDTQQGYTYHHGEQRGQVVRRASNARRHGIRANRASNGQRRQHFRRDRELHGLRVGGGSRQLFDRGQRRDRHGAGQLQHRLYKWQPGSFTSFQSGRDYAAHGHQCKQLGRRLQPHGRLVSRRADGSVRDRGSGFSKRSFSSRIARSDHNPTCKRSRDTTAVRFYRREHDFLNDDWLR